MNVLLYDLAYLFIIEAIHVICLPSLYLTLRVIVEFIRILIFVTLRKHENQSGLTVMAVTI